jgi:hypothetical protein
MIERTPTPPTGDPTHHPTQPTHNPPPRPTLNPNPISPSCPYGLEKLQKYQWIPRILLKTSLVNTFYTAAAVSKNLVGGSESFLSKYVEKLGNP